jgi:hypothetical protein
VRSWVAIHDFGKTDLGNHFHSGQGPFTIRRDKSPVLAAERMADGSFRQPNTAANVSPIQKKFAEGTVHQEPSRLARTRGGNS